jgi:chromosome segregation ATPase
MQEKSQLEAGYLSLREKLEDQEGVPTGPWVLENKGLHARISSLEKDLDLACQISEDRDSQNLVKDSEIERLTLTNRELRVKLDSGEQKYSSTLDGKKGDLKNLESIMREYEINISDSKEKIKKITDRNMALVAENKRLTTDLKDNKTTLDASKSELQSLRTKDEADKFAYTTILQKQHQ